jgi:hypothetical protein
MSLDPRRLVVGAEITAKRQLRAYVTVTEGGIAPVFKGEDQIYIGADVFVKNSGQTPAYKFGNWTTIDVFDTESPDLKIDGRGSTESVIGSQGERSIPVSKGPVSKSDFDLIREKKKHIFVWGVIHYRDAFNEDRFFEFYLRNGEEITGKGWPLLPANQPSNGN